VRDDRDTSDSYRSQIQSHLDSHRPLLLDTYVNESAWTTASEALSISDEPTLDSKGFPHLSERILDILQWILLVVALELVEKVAHGDSLQESLRLSVVIEQHSLWVTWDSDDEPYVESSTVLSYCIYGTVCVWWAPCYSKYHRRCSNLHDRETR
jgi:hypothetical protein